MTLTKSIRAPSDRMISRVIRGSALVLLIGVPLVSAIYVFDRWVPSGPTFVDRQIQSLEKAVEAQPNAITIRLQLAGAYTAAARYDAAIGQFDQILKADASNKTALLGRADALRLSADLDGARKGYQAVVDLTKGGEFAPVDTELQRAYYELGSIALQQSRWSDAVAALTEAIRVNKTDADSLDLLGSAYLHLGQVDSAIQQLRQAVLYVPSEWPEPYQLLAQAYEKKGAADEAIWASAMAAIAARKPGDAERRLSGLTSGPASVDAMLGLGILSELRGDRESAATWYRKVLAADPGSFSGQVGMARVTDPAASPGAEASSAGVSQNGN